MCECVYVGVCMCVCVHTCILNHVYVQERTYVCMCVCICSLLLGNSNFKDPYLLAQLSGLGDCKVARVCRPATDYKLVVRPWESGI